MKAATRQRWGLLAAGAVALSLIGRPGFASTPSAAPTPVPFAALFEMPSLGEMMQRDLRTGLAINGFDPVSYRLGTKPMAGRAEYELIQDRFVWRFASQANLEAFRDAPDIYMPAFGGFDPTGVANGLAVESDPSQFAVIGSRLFLFRSAGNRQRFLREAGLLAQAESRWNAVLRLVAR
ncbi:YHS domain-containing (seleno)protein [Bosea beijingensis]|uniref:YHS domain-containing (seleno)protein n=1 Tax=Bosea beijingensis TaxID=3068632 RepID=UPI0027425AF4|nr:YHS domain-containing (seleno)protein [Bosea sp. REN20]